jgi:xylan 1,4-beta-xylosidase
MIQNPILRGFHPDASVCKVGKDIYIATSTFEWWPGVEIYHTKDLINFELVAQPLNRISQLSMTGNRNSGGIWAPHLSYADGKFWLAFTDVKTCTKYKDTLNYIITCDKIDGEWSEPIFINASGFDPALFHDEDGKKYFINMLFDHREDHPSFSGVIIQEYDPLKRKLIGKRKLFYEGTSLGVCEGPQIFKKDGYYYLVCAAGGTGYAHASTVARSRKIMGEYENSPYFPLITTKSQPENLLQKAGHASFVEIDGEWYITHICSRPLTKRGNAVLGRETALQKIIWVDGWPKLENGTIYPDLYVPKPKNFKNVLQNIDNSSYCNFSEENLPSYFKCLRKPLGDKISLSKRKGWLRLYGEQSLSSLHSQTLIARRWQSFNFTAETAFEFNPQNFQQMAGLVCFYNTENWMYACATYDEEKACRILKIECADLNNFSEPLGIDVVNIPDKVNLIYLRVEVNREKLQFYYSFGNKKFEKLGDVLPADHLSDDYIEKSGLVFTGAFVGICCQDLDRHTAYADFKYFNYIENKTE